MVYLSSKSPSHARTGSVGGKLRSIFAPKPNLPPACPVISFPSRVSVRKREIHEVTSDENDIGSLAFHPPRVRQRLDSDASIETIRPPTPRSRTPTCRSTVDQIISDNGNAETLTRCTSYSTPASTDARHTSSTKGPLQRSTSDNSLRASCPEAMNNFMSLPKNPATLHKESNTPAAPPSQTSGLQPLRWTQSRRSLHPGNARAEEPLSAEDEAIVRDIVASIATEEQDVAHIEESERLPDASAIPTIPDEFQDEYTEDGETSESEHDIRPIAPTITVHPHELKAPTGRFEVQIKPRNMHITMWDITDQDFYAWPALLCIANNEPTADPLQGRCPVQWYDLLFYSLHSHNAHITDADDAAAHAEYATRYTGQSLPPTLVFKLFDPARGICTSTAWGHIGAHVDADAPGGSWRLRFWVPIPMSLFNRLEGRRFRVRARVGLSDQDISRAVVDSGLVDISMEHLHKAKEMQ